MLIPLERRLFSLLRPCQREQPSFFPAYAKGEKGGENAMGPEKKKKRAFQKQARTCQPRKGKEASIVKMGHTLAAYFRKVWLVLALWARGSTTTTRRARAGWLVGRG